VGTACRWSAHVPIAGDDAMDTTELGFIAAIHENPQDDAIRLIFADWLEERGDPYGEFIRIQCHESHIGVLMARSKPIALPDCTPECAKMGRRLLELFPAVIASERFAFWHRMKKQPPLFRGLCYQFISDAEAMRYDPPPMVRLSLSVLAANRLLEQLLTLPIMAQVDHITLAMPLPKMPLEEYEDQLLALLEWPGLENLESVSLGGAKCEAAERLSQRVRVSWVEA